ncbi:MAG: hypothetical protein K6E91_08865 [Butyrivibrio sp.]|nr:hypothetical protein [Butyrivibrio sp.]
MKKFADFIEKFIDLATGILWEIIMVWCFVIVIFLNDLPMGDWIRKRFLLPNWALLSIGIAILIGYLFLTGNRKPNFHIFSSSVLLFILQLFVAVQIYFKPGWDAGNNLLTDAWTLANGLPLGEAITYYSQYNQNLLLLCIESAIMRLPVLLGVTTFEYGYISLVAAQCLISAITGYFVYDLILTFSDGSEFREKIAFIGWLFYVLLIGTSPWSVVVYSDGFGLIFPVLTIWLWTRFERLSGVKKYLTFLLLCLVSYIGYSIKATVIVAFIAVMMITVCRFLAKCLKDKRADFISAAAVTASVLVVFTGGKACLERLYDRMGLELDMEMKVTAYHYLMIGWNEEESGTFNGPDLKFTSYIPDFEDRKEANISESKRRIKSMLPFHIFVWQAKKTNENYHDGTFSWWVEGDFCVESYKDRIPVVSSFLKDVFWADGKYNRLFTTLEQTTWLLILFLCLIPIKTKDSCMAAALRLSLIGTFFFVEIFEARSRYLYVFGTLFVINAALSAGVIMHLISRAFSPKQTKGQTAPDL